MRQVRADKVSEESKSDLVFLSYEMEDEMVDTALHWSCPQRKKNRRMEVMCRTVQVDVAKRKFSNMAPTVRNGYGIQVA